MTQSEVDIIVPVFNSPKYTQYCLQSIYARSGDVNYRLIIVNDGSDSETTLLLRDFAEKKANCELLENQVNLGYTESVNIGMRKSNAPFVVLLNSDTEVPEKWLSGLLKCITSDKKIGVVGPLSNAASWQTVPKLLDENRQFCVNAIPEGVSVKEMASMVASVSLCHYPVVPFVNGFCFMIRREVIEKIGYMDSEAFPRGYGEENDYCLRAAHAGFNLAIADDVYVYHAKSKSFGHEQRKSLSKNGSESLKKKYGTTYFNEQASKMRNIPTLDALRKRLIRKLEQRHIKKSIDFKDIKVLFILPKPGVGGGSHSVVQETKAMRDFGVDAAIAVEQRHLDMLYERYQEVSDIESLFVGYVEENFLEIVSHYDVAIATIFHTTNLVKCVIDAFPHILPAYYVQDYEPLFFDESNFLYNDALESYNRLDNALLFAKTYWIARQVESNHGVPVEKVVPSIDHDVYYKSLNGEGGESREDDGVVHIAAMIRPRTPRRGAGRTMQLLYNLKNRFGEKIEIHLFGCSTDELVQYEIDYKFDHEHYGILQRTGVAELLRAVDIFVDLSDYQAFGRTALEAMACGATAMVPSAGGTDEYAIDEVNALIVDTYDIDACEQRLADLINDKTHLENLKKAALESATNFSPLKAAESELKLIQTFLTVHRQSFSKPDKRPIIYILNDDRERGFHFFQTDACCNALWQIKNIEDLPQPENVDVGVLLTRGKLSSVSESRFSEWYEIWSKFGGTWVHEVNNPRFLKEPIVKWAINTAPVVAVSSESQSFVKNIKGKLLVSPTKAFYLLELRTALYASRKSLHQKTKVRLESVEKNQDVNALKMHIQCDRRRRLWHKFRNSPRTYFADSRHASLRYLKYFFPK